MTADRSAGNRRARLRPVRSAGTPAATGADVLVVHASEPRDDCVVGRSERVLVTWRLGNAGAVAWRRRRLQRVGATGGVRLLSGPPSVPVADTAPGEQVEVSVSLCAPDYPGTVVGYWEMLDEHGEPPDAGDVLLTVRLVVR